MAQAKDLRTVVEGILDRKRDLALESQINKATAHTQDPEKNIFKGGQAGGGNKDSAETSGFSDPSSLGEGDDDVLSDLDKVLGQVANTENPDFDSGGDDDDGKNTPAGSTLDHPGPEGGDDALHDGPISERRKPKKEAEDDDEDDDDRNGDEEDEDDPKSEAKDDEEDDKEKEDFMKGESSEVDAILRALSLVNR